MELKKTGQKQNYFLQHEKPKKGKKDEGGSRIMDAVDLGSLKNDFKDGKWVKEWTLMNYAAADNNLKEFMEGDMNEMETIGSTSQMNMLSQFDYGDTCKRFYLERDNKPDKVRSPVLDDLGKTNMADPRVLADFIKFSMKKYPAKNYILLISDHGLGWKGIAEDESHKGWMTMPTVRKGLELAQKETGQKVNVVGFDACLMASTEVVKELKGQTDFIVASEQTEGGDGWPYTPLLNPDNLDQMTEALKQDAQITPKLLATAIVETAKSDQESLPTLSAIDMKQVGKLTKASDDLARLIIKTDTPGSLLRNISRNTENFYIFKDQYHFAEQIAKSDEIKDNKLKKGARNLMKAIGSAVIAEQHSNKHPNAHGLTAEIPSYSSVGKGYKKLKFAKKTLWEEAMAVIDARAKMDGVTAEAIEIPKLKRSVTNGLKKLGEIPGLGKLAELAKTGFSKFAGEAAARVDGFEYLAGEDKFAREKGRGMAGIIAIAGIRGMIDLNADTKEFESQARGVIGDIAEKGKFTSLSQGMYDLIIESSKPQTAEAPKEPPEEGEKPVEEYMDEYLIQVKLKEPEKKEDQKKTAARYFRARVQG